MQRLCTVLAAVFVSLLSCPAAQAEDWPQWRGPGRDGVWRETGILDTFPESRIALRWSVPISNGYSGPTVAAGRVFVTDRVLGPEEAERVLCFDAATGNPLWTFVYPCRYEGVGYRDGPRASVTIDNGLAYALGTMGHLHCLDAETGAVVWRKQPATDYDVEQPTWGVAAAPLVEGELLIAQLGAKPDACVVAWDKRTGEERWRALPDQASYAAPIVVNQTGRRVVVCWTGDGLVGLDSDTGALRWRYPTPPVQMVINIATPVFHDGRIFLSSFYDGAYLLRLQDDRSGVDLAWHRAGPNERKTDALHALLSTPLILDSHIYGVDTHGELRCLDLETGDRLWEDTTAVARNRWANIHMVRNAGRVWMFNEQGELIISRLTPDGFEALSRARLIAPTQGQLGRGEGVCWAHPAYANRHVYARNDEVLVCASLAAE